MSDTIEVPRELIVSMRSWCWQLAGFFQATKDRPDLQANAERLMHMGERLDAALKVAESLSNQCTCRGPDAADPCHHGDTSEGCPVHDPNYYDDSDD